MGLQKKDRSDPLSSYVSGLLGLQERSELRQLTTVDDLRSGEIQIGGRWFPNFTSNDYLGLSTHPACRQAAQEAIQQWGVGSASSRVVTGGVPPHELLERRLKRWISTARAVIFPSGYQANVGLISALAGSEDTLFSDEHNHASIVDGCRLSGARVEIYPHLDLNRLSERLRRASGRRFIVTESLFSMDGSVAPLRSLSELARDHNALLLVDEAHAMGLLGPEGRGLCAAADVCPDALMGTFSKALGSHGAFVAAAEPVADWLINRGRSFVYTTALPPPVLAASLAALNVVRSTEGAQRQDRVLGFSESLRARLSQAGFPVDGRGTPLVSLLFGQNRAVTVSERLRQAGFLVWAFRPPTVPRGSSRLRISLSASHRPSQVEGLADALLRELEHSPPLPDLTRSGAC